MTGLWRVFLPWLLLVGYGPASPLRLGHQQLTFFIDLIREERLCSRRIRPNRRLQDPRNGQEKSRL